MNAGPLAGVRVVELGGIGPAPFAAMLMSDLAAEVVRIDRPPSGRLGEHQQHERDLLLRGRRSSAVDLKSGEGVEVVLRLLEQADVLLDPFRPGVTERLGIGPDPARIPRWPAIPALRRIRPGSRDGPQSRPCAGSGPDPAMARNPGLAYARMTGWGQTGPLAGVADHDLNYVALAGPLAARGSPPPPALNLVGDFGGGGMLVAFGIAAALLERNRSGAGQVIDAAMLDGVAMLSATIVGFSNMGVWRPERESNILDGGAPYYGTYETSDGRYVTIGSIEPQFYALLLEKLDLDPAERPQEDRSRWPAMHTRFAEIFLTGRSAEWCALFEGTDVCFAPVLGFDEARNHPHLAARGTCSRRRCRASAGRPAPSSPLPARPGSTPARCCGTGDSPPTSTRGCSARAPWSRPRAWCGPAE
jgi:alpha-methylacyl-CoA racemase